MSREPFFSCKNLQCSYGAAPVVTGISVEVFEREFASLVGAYGVGKTTLFRALAGLSVPEEGVVYLEGIDITGVAGRVGYMPQKDMLLPWRTILDNAILPLVIRGVKKKEARERAAQLFPAFGLTGFENYYPHEISGGMRQRAAFLRTSLAKSRMFLLDEPFSALDAMTRAEIQGWYSEIAARLSLSTLLITHDIDEALRLSNAVYVMAGKPARIVLSLKIERTQAADFCMTQQFASYKEQITRALSS